MNFKIRRRLTYFTISFFFLCGGIEYAVVFPTIWAYLQHLGAHDETFLGFAVAAFSVSAIIVGPIVGKWFDKSRNAKIALMVANLFEIGGSLMYFSAVSPWFVVFSRFVCGIGSGAGTVVLADISLSTVIQDRTSILSRLQACRQVGLISGPAFNILFQQFHFDIWDFPVNPMTSPGLFMAALGILLQCLFAFAYFNLGTLKEHEKLAESLCHSYIDGDALLDVERAIASRQLSRDRMCIQTEPARSIVIAEDNASVEVTDKDAVTVSVIDPDVQRRLMNDARRTSSTNGMIESAEVFIANSLNPESLDGVFHDNEHITEQSGGFENPRSNSDKSGKLSAEKGSPVQDFVEEFIRHEVVVILGLTFISYFAQTSFETVVTPLTQLLYNFGAFENSVLFLICGVLILFSFLATAALSKRFEDRLLILIGMIFLTFAMAWFLYFVPQSKPGDWSSLYYFAIGVFFDLLGVALLIACSVSLFSKLISKERQGFGQGLRRSFGFAGTILGPLWAGSFTKRPVMLFAVPLSLVTIMLLLFMLSYVDLHVVIVETSDASKDKSVAEVDERTPLIANRSNSFNYLIATNH